MLRDFGNKASIRRLARRSIRANRRRNLAAMLTIAFTALVLSAIVLTVAARRQESYDSLVLKGWDVEIRGVTDEQLREMEEDPEIDRVGIKRNIGMIHLPGATVKIAYYDENLWNYHQTRTPIPGRLPQKEGEVGISAGYLELLGAEAGLGDTIQLDLGHGLRAYTITALPDDAVTGAGSYYVFVPRSAYDEFARSRDGRHIAYLWLRGIDPADRQEVAAAARRLEERYDFGNGYASTYTPAFQHYYQYSTSRYLLFVGIGLAICGAGAIVIYTIFFISVSGRVREFGQMRTLGATRGQIRRLVLCEAAMLAPPAIISGFVCGGLTAYRMEPRGWVWTTSLLLCFIIALVCLAGVLAGVAKPAKTAAETSPMEALRHSGYNSGSKAGRRMAKSRTRRITPAWLARMNFTCSPKRAAFTLLSLVICGILLICGASLQSTLRPEALVRVEMRDGNFRIRLTEDSFLLGAEGTGRDEDRVQLEGNPLDAELMEQIKRIDGVLEVRERSGLFIRIYAQGGATLVEDRVFGYDQRDYSRMEASLTGMAAYDPGRPEAALVVRSPETFKEIYGWMPEIGEVVQMEYLNSTGEYRMQDLRITGLIGKSDGIDHFFRVPAPVLESLTGYNISMEWHIRTDPEMDKSIEEELLLLLQERSNLTMDTYAARLRAAASTQSVYAMLYALVGIFGLFGIINLINTTTTSLLARRGEMALYRALGMTVRQLMRSLLVEGSLFTVGSILLSTVVGTPVSVLICRLADPTGVVPYRFPVLAMLVYAGVLLLVQGLLLLHTKRCLPLPTDTGLQAA